MSIPRGQTFDGLQTYVLSRTLTEVADSGVTLVSDDASEVVRQLRETPGKEIWLFGGVVLFASLLEARLVDMVEVAVVPILLGEGLPMLPPMARRTRLALTETQEYPSGIVLLKYDVIADESPADG